MEDINLFELIEDYKKLQDEEKALKDKLDVMKEQIIKEMQGSSRNKVELPSGVVAFLTEAITYKYTDEPRIIKYLKDNGLTNYIIEKINTTPLNTELKKGMALTENLSPYYTSSVTTKLTVK